jgi:hypothetical protein
VTTARQQAWIEVFSPEKVPETPSLAFRFSCQHKIKALLLSNHDLGEEAFGAFKAGRRQITLGVT